MLLFRKVKIINFSKINSKINYSLHFLLLEKKRMFTFKRITLYNTIIMTPTYYCYYITHHASENN